MKDHNSFRARPYAQVLVAAAAYAARSTVVSQTVQQSNRGFGYATHLDGDRHGAALHWLRRR